MLASFPKVPKTYSESLENRRFRLPHCRLTPRLQGTPANIPINLILPETIVIALHICRYDSMGLSSFKYSWWGLRKRTYFETVQNGCSRSSKVTYFGTNQQRVCNWIINSNLGPILPRFRETAGFSAGFLLRTATPPCHPYTTRMHSPSA